MKCNNRNGSVTIGDLFNFAVFKGNVFVWSKQKTDDIGINNNDIHFEEVTPITMSNLLSGQSQVLTTGFVGIQASSKYIIEQYSKSRNEPIIGETTVGLLKDKQPTCRYGDR